MLQAGQGVVLIGAEPHQHGLAHHVVFGYEAPVTAVCRVVTIVSLHPVIVHLEGVLRGLLAVDEYLAVGCNLQVVALIGSDGALVDGQVLQCEVQRGPLLGYPDGAVVVTGPSRIGVLRVERAGLAVLYDAYAGHHILALLQGCLGSLGEGEYSRLVEIAQVVLTDACLFHQCGWYRLAHKRHVVVVLHVFGIGIHLSVEVHDAVLYLERLSWQAHAALYVVLPTVNRARVYASEIALVHGYVLLAKVVYLAVELPLLHG